MEFRDYLRVIRRRLGWFLGVFGIVVGGYGAVAVKTESRVYHATCRLLVGPTRVQPLFQGLETYFPGSVRMNPQTRVAGIGSRQVKAMAAERLAEARPAPGKDRFFERQFVDAETLRPHFAKEVLAVLRESRPGVSEASLQADEGFGKALDAKVRQAALGAIVGELEQACRVETLEKTDLVQIHAAADGPLKAVAMANAMADAAVDFNARFDLDVLARARERAELLRGGNQEKLVRLAEEIKAVRKNHGSADLTLGQQLADRRGALKRRQDEMGIQLAWMDQVEQLEARWRERERALEAMGSARPAGDPEARALAAEVEALSRQHAALLAQPPPGAGAQDGSPGEGPAVLERLQARREGIVQARAAVQTRMSDLARRREGLARRREMERARFLEMTLSKEPELARLKAAREAEEKRLEALRARYTERHPEVRATLRGIASLGEQYDARLRRFQEDEAREHAYQLALLDLEKAFLDEEDSRRAQELLETDRDVAAVRSEAKLGAARAFSFRKTFLHEELSRLDREAKGIEEEIRQDALRRDSLRYDEEVLLERQRQLQTESALFSAFLGRSSLVSINDAETRPVSLFEAADPQNVVLERSDALPLFWFMCVIGFLVSLGVVFLMEYMDTTLKTEYDVRRHLNLPVLAIVPQQPKGRKVLLTQVPPRDPLAEVFMSAATLIRSAAKDLGIRTLAVTSTVPQEGKTTTSVNLAVALARKGMRVILLDADLRMPQVHALLGLDNAGGLSTFLDPRSKGGKAPPPGGDVLSALLRPTAVPNLRVVTSGPVTQDPAVLLESVRMKALIEEIKGQSDLVICDTPPASSVGDTLTLSTLCDAILFVVGAGLAEQHRVAWVKHLLSHVEAKILGCILNRASIEGATYYYYDHEQGKSRRARG